MKQHALCALVLLTTLAACKKDDDGGNTTIPTTPTCRITTADIVDGGDSSRTTLAYDADGKVTSVTASGEVTAFTYSGSNIYVSRAGGLKDTITVNGDGLITQQRAMYDFGGGMSYGQRTDYTYNGTEVQRAIRTVVFGGVPVTDTTFYTWSGGNCVREEADLYTSTYEYDTDKPLPAAGGDVFTFQEYIINGAAVIRNKNLRKSANIEGAAINFTYEFDSNGNISKVTVNGDGGTASVRYGYTCQ